MNIRSVWLTAEGLLFAFALQMSAAAHASGALSAAVNYPVGASPQTIVTGDFNNDGRLDLATGNPLAETQDGSATVSVLLGDGAGGFGAAIDFSLLSFGFNRMSLTAADFDNDGDDDLAFTLRSTETSEATAPGILLSNGDGAFGSPAWPSASVFSEAVASGDFNNDGHSDLVVTGYTIDLFGQAWGDARVLLGNGQGGFANSPHLGLIDGGYQQLAVGDLNGDGKLDAVGTSGEFYGYGMALLGDGGDSGVFSNYHEFHTTSDRSGGVAVGDFTGDGIPDLVTAGGTLDIHVGRGDGTFDEPTAYSTNANGHAGVAVADLNGDGLLDAVTADPGAGTVSELLGNGSGVLTFAVAYAVGSLPMAVAVGDFNGDGRPDVATANSGSNDVSVLLNQTTLAPSADFNHDGSIDAADLLKWQGDFGQNALSDADNDGDSDGADFLAWQRQFGAGPVNPPTNPVPEPAALLLAVVSLLAARCWKTSAIMPTCCPAVFPKARHERRHPHPVGHRARRSPGGRRLAASGL